MDDARVAARLSLTWSATVTTDYSAEQSVQATRRVLSGATRPTAVVYDNDVMAVAGTSVAHETPAGTVVTMTVTSGQRSSSVPVLTRRALNRATLERQLLLRRSQLSPVEAIERLVGLQAQTPHTWYVGLWSRLEGFDPQKAGDLLWSREVVRIAVMRSTIHLVTADDALTLRPLTQPVIERVTSGVFGRGVAGLDPAELARAGRTLVDERPLMFSELGRLLAERWPDRDPSALAQTVRALVPLVQVPPRGVWGRSGQSRHTSVEAWLGRPGAESPSLPDMVLRYLDAFGPASVLDIQAWCGLTRLSEVVDGLRPQLLIFRDESGRELFDVPAAPRPDPDTPAPARFLYDFDNLLLSYADRTRVVTVDFAEQEFTPNNMPRAVLVDGFVAATWTVARQRTTATLTIRPFGDLPKSAKDELIKEGTSLLEFLEPRATTHNVRFTA